MKVIDLMNSEDILDIVKVRDLIAAALKHEREEAGMGAINWFLFSEKSTKAKAKRLIAQKYCTRKHLDKRAKA